MGKRAIDPAIRFWAKVERTDSCWLWHGKISPFGYGRFSLPNPEREVAAHHFSYELSRGPIKDGLLVCHSCDIRHCVRPEHLFLGTQRDNIRDAMDKGRFTQIQFLKRGNSLSEDDVREIKRVYYAEEDSTYKSIATEYRVHPAMIASIIKGRSWKHVH